MSIDIEDIAKSTAAQISHVNCSEDEDMILTRLREDVPEFYGLVKEQLKRLASPESDPPSQVGTPTGISAIGKIGMLLGSIEQLAIVLRKYGVWASLAVMLIVSSILGYELKKLSRKYEGVLQKLAQYNPSMAAEEQEEDK